jgi:phage baseplate assembly protein W
MQPTATDWSLKLNTPGALAEGIADIDQCIGIILTTPKGADPHRPQFGCDLWKHLDRPGRRAVPFIVREATDAIRLWEPRIEVVRVTPEPATADESHWTIAIEWRLKGDGTVRRTEVKP